MPPQKLNAIRKPLYLVIGCKTEGLFNGSLWVDNPGISIDPIVQYDLRWEFLLHW